MSDIIESLKDVVNPERREKATAPDYDPQKRGPYADKPSKSEPQVDMPKAGLNDSKTNGNSAQVKATPVPSDTRTN